MVQKLIISVLCIGLLIGCSNNEGASAEQIGNALAMQLPTGLEVDDVEIQVAENLGTKVEPAYQTRSKVTLRYTENFYEQINSGRKLDKAVVKQISSEGDVIIGTLITSSRLNGENWDVYIEKRNFPAVYGRAESQFGVSGFVMDGSDEHKALIEKYEEDLRLASELKAKKEAEEAAARKQRVAELRQTLTGTWAAKQPAVHNGKVWASRKGGQLGIQLNLEEGEGQVGSGTAILYDYNNPVDELEVPVSFKIDDSGEYAALTFTKDVEHESLRFGVGPRYQWKLTGDGSLTYDASRNQWSLSLEKDGKALADRLAQIENYQEKQKKYEELIEKHQAFIAKGELEDLNLRTKTYANYFVIGDTDGRVFGDEQYFGGSDVATAAVHSGALKEGQAGIVKIAKYDSRIYFKGTIKNGITSESYNRTRNPYTIELVEALPTE